MEVAERTVMANGLNHHVIVWSPDRSTGHEEIVSPPALRGGDARVASDRAVSGDQPTVSSAVLPIVSGSVASDRAMSGAQPTVLCLHGFLDLAWSFRRVAELLVAKGNRVVAVDWRGHAESDWVGAGGYYYFADYIADAADLVEALVPGRLHLVGHSMGGSAALLYAGTFPDRVERLVLAEGMGPPEPEQPLPERMAQWVRECREVRARRDTPLVMPSVEAALARMKRTNPDLPDDLGLELATRGTRPVEGGVVWRWDPLHRTRGPYPFRKPDFMSFARAVRCPVLVIDGENGYRTTDHADRLTAFGDVRSRMIPGAGHMMHWTAPEAMADAIMNGW